MPPALTPFRRQGIWPLLGLTLITGTIYWSFWLRRNTRLLNGLLPQRAISGWFFPVTILLTVLNLGWGIPEALSHDNPDVLLAGQLIEKADILLTVIWIFKVRNRFNTLLDAAKGNDTWFSALWTVPLGVLYLQYHLNELLNQSQPED